MNLKTLLLFISFTMLINNVSGQESPQQKFKKLEWLVGKWTRTNPQAGESGYETWAKITDSKLTGKGFTLKGGKTIFVENLEFIIRGNDIFYTVKVTGEKKATDFKLTALSKDAFTCENPEHDFPKKISYKRIGNLIKATISGNGQSMDYNFIRAK